MDAIEQIKAFQDFLEKNYKAELAESIRKGENRIILDFSILAQADLNLAEDLLDQTEDTIKAAELAVQEFETREDLKNFRVRFKNLPESQKIMIRNIRSNHIGKFLSIEGVVRQKSDVRPQVTTARFECPSCGNIIGQIQLDSVFKEPSRCSCGRKGKFKLLNKQLVDAQGIVLEESPENLEGGEQPKRMNVFLTADLVSPLSEKRTNPGTKINVTGIIKEIPIILRSGVKSTRSDLLIDANYIDAANEDFYEIKITEKEEEEIKELSRDPKLYDRMIKSIAPSIYGYDRIKEALLLQMMGGIQKVRKDGAISRGDIHVLLIGDPGSGKSQLLKRMAIIAPKGRYVSGKGASGAGLTASVVKDEFLKGWSLEAGALVLANKGVCMIDELDKMSHEDRSAMHEALEQQTVTISKANIQATLVAKTTVLAAANPKFGRFDPYENLAKQIDLPVTLINRFDLIFPIKDLPNPEKDEEIAKHMLMLHQKPKINVEDISTDLMRKYMAYAKQKVTPALSDSALEEIKKYYLQMRSKYAEEGEVKVVPISPRQLEALIRLAEASAKVRLSTKVTKKDAKRAIDILHYCLSQIGIDPETGKIDIDRITTGITASQRSKISTIREIIEELENSIGKNIPIEDIIKEAKEKGVPVDITEEVLEKLKRSGDLFEPKRGFIQRI